MSRRRTLENTPRTLGLALSLWAAAVAAGTYAGIFTKLAPGELAGLALFAFGFATATAWLDRGLRAFLDSIAPRRLFSFVIEADILIALSAMVAVPLLEGAILPALGQFPLALVVLFVAPVAATAHLVAIARLQSTGSERTRLAPGRVPSAR